MAKKKKKRQPVYNPLAPWNQSIGQMRNNAARQAQDQLAALIGSLPTQAALRDAQAREAQGLGRINTAFVSRLNQAAQNAAGAGAGITAAYQGAANQANASGNRLAAAAGGPPIAATSGGALLAANAAGMAGALQGNVQAGAAMGALEQNASLARLASALKDRQSQVTGYRARYGSLFDDALNSLYQRAMQQTTMRDNSRLAWSQFGEQQQQNDVNNAQQDAAAAADNAYRFAQLSAQEQADAARDDEAGRVARQKIIKRLRAEFFKRRNATTNGRAPGPGDFTYKVRVRQVDDDGAISFKTYTETIYADSPEAAYAQLNRKYRLSQSEGTATATLTKDGRTKIKTRKNQDKDLAAEYRQALRKAGFQQAAANQILNNWLRRRWGTSY